MTTKGRCYCGCLIYEINGQAEAAFQCHCRECQYITGANPNIVMVFAKSAFRYKERNPEKFASSDLETPVTRHFCGDCGTAMGTESPAHPNAMIEKVGTLDAPSAFAAQAAIFTCDIQPFHHLPDGLTAFDK